MRPSGKVGSQEKCTEAALTDTEEISTAAFITDSVSPRPDLLE